jgi:hypothetical protein
MSFLSEKKKNYYSWVELAENEKNLNGAKKKNQKLQGLKMWSP